MGHCWLNQPQAQLPQRTLLQPQTLLQAQARLQPQARLQQQELFPIGRIVPPPPWEVVTSLAHWVHCWSLEGLNERQATHVRRCV